jgi:monoamine oxidase
MNEHISDVDIVIIGAGAAGLAAGATLQRAGASFVVLEARDRRGGRGWTTTAGGHPVDLGCGWLHSAEENPFVGVAGEHHVALDRSAAPWQKQAWTGNFSDDEQEDYRESWDAFYERLENGASGADQPAGVFLEPGNRWNPLIDAGSTFINGVELGGLSTIDYDRYHDSGVNWRAPTGFGALIARMGEGLPIRLNCPVSTIDHSGARIRVDTPNGVIAARAVIVTVSTDLLAVEAVRFTPALPAKIEAASRLPLGLADKLFLSLANADDLPIDGRLYGSRDRVGVASYHLRPFGRPLIECYFGGQFARDLERAGEAAFADFAIAEIVDAMGSNMRARLVPVACSRWALDPFARGSYSHARVGHSDARAALAAPVDDRIFFAGEACSRHDFSTAHGAFRTGVAAATAALQHRAGS